MGRPACPGGTGDRSQARVCVLARPYGPKGQESLAQGSPWVISPPELALKGPLGTTGNHLRTS